jgi:hypothetical protein
MERWKGTPGRPGEKETRAWACKHTKSTCAAAAGGIGGAARGALPVMRLGADTVKASPASTFENARQHRSALPTSCVVQKGHRARMRMLFIWYRMAREITRKPKRRRTGERGGRGGGEISDLQHTSTPCSTALVAKACREENAREPNVITCTRENRNDMHMTRSGWLIHGPPASHRLL